MITIKKLKLSEYQVITSIKKFVNKHPVITYCLLGLFIVSIMISTMSIIILAGAGGSCIETREHGMLLTGEISASQYVLLMNVLNIESDFIDYLVFLNKLILAIPVAILFYEAYKYYLQYKRDNL
jgi:hypothetical protein